MKKLKNILAFVLVLTLMAVSVPLTLATTEKTYIEGFEDYSSGDMLYDYSNTSNNQPFISYGNNSRNRFSQEYANLYLNTDAALSHSGNKSMYGTTFYLWATARVDLAPNTEYELSFWYMLKEDATTYTYLSRLSYGILTADTTNCTGLTEVSGCYKVNNYLSGELKAGEWKEATLTFTTGDDTSNMVFGYKYDDKDDSGTTGKATLYVDDICIMPVVDEEGYKYEKTFDFENYAVNELLYDSANTSNDQPFIGYNYKLERQTASWANLTAISAAAYVKNGQRAMRGNTPCQFVTTKLSLRPNTRYYAEFWYTYSHAYSHLTQMTYGFYKTDDDCTRLTRLSDQGATVTELLDESYKAGEWRKAGISFTTGADVKNLVFGYYYLDEYVDSSGNTVQNKATLYVDDMKIVNATPISITVNSKNNAVALPKSGSFDAAPLGSEFSFEVITEPGLTPTVTLNGAAITPVDGLYTVTVTENMVIDISCGADDEGRPWQGQDRYGNDLTAYDREIYMKPFGDNNTVYHETVLFHTDRDTAKLLYPVSEVIALRSYDLTTAYIQGVDYEITADGQIKRLENSRIPLYTSALVGGINSAETNKSFTTADGQYLQFIGDTTYPKYAVAVTYEYDTLWAEGEGFRDYKVASSLQQLPLTAQKLKNGEDINIVVYGDSTSCGWSSSGLNSVGEIYDETNTEGKFIDYSINVAPYAETWIAMLIGSLRDAYPDSTITCENIALGGKTANWGKSNLAARMALLKNKPDLMILAFGGNDLLAGVAPATFGANTKGIIDVLRNESNTNGNADAEVLLWSPKINNTLCTKYAADNFLAFETALDSVATDNDGVALARFTTYMADVLNSKPATDYLNTNVNHGNDFCARMIAQTLFKALTPNDTADGLQTAYNGVAALRTASESSTGKNGLRVYNEINRSWFASAEIVEFGSVATLTKSLNGATLTLDFTNFVKGVAYKEGTQAMLLWNTTDDAYLYTSYLTNIDEAYYGELFTIRTYAIDKNGRVYYGNEQEVCVFDIANAIDHGNTADGSSVSDEDKAAFELFAAPDGDFADYDAWLAKSGNTPGSLRNAK